MIKKIKEGISSSKVFLRLFGYKNFRALVGSGLEFEILENVPQEKVLIIAPHPDDDVIGCGGAIIQHVQQEDEVAIIYLSDGSLGFPQGVRPSASERAEMAKKREAEATKAAKIMGVKNINFWRFKDGAIQTNKTTIKLLENLLLSYKPDIIYCPFPLDDHPDHIEAGKMLYEALRITDSQARICCYEVWMPLVANKILKIDQQAQKKFEALGKHESQLASRNYVEAIRGLNKYRAGMYACGDYAEAYFCSSANYFLKIFFQIKSMNRIK